MQEFPPSFGSGCQLGIDIDRGERSRPDFLDPLLHNLVSISTLVTFPRNGPAFLLKNACGTLPWHMYTLSIAKDVRDLSWCHIRQFRIVLNGCKHPQNSYSIVRQGVRVAKRRISNLAEPRDV